MKFFRFLRWSIPAVLILGSLDCKLGSDVTSSRGSLARLSLDAPDSARSGESFGVDVLALNIGVNNIHDGRVDIMLPAPLSVLSVDPSAGTAATFTSGASGSRVAWTLNTLDSNSRSTLRIRAMGTLQPGEATRRLTIQATMIGEGIRPGDAVARDDMDLTRQ